MKLLLVEKLSERKEIGQCGPHVLPLSLSCPIRRRGILSQHWLLHLGAFSEANIGCEDSATTQFFLTPSRSCGKHRICSRGNGFTCRLKPLRKCDAPFGCCHTRMRQHIWMGRVAEIAANC